MVPLKQVAESILQRARRGENCTLLAVCPNSAAVLEAAIKSAARKKAPMLFAATLNQVDVDGGYTGWTPARFSALLEELARSQGWNGPLYRCLDHGGPWMKDMHAMEGLSAEEAMAAVKRSITACVRAGYDLLHIDATANPTTQDRGAVAVDLVVARTVELILHAEKEREQLGRGPIAYEVGTEEVRGGLTEEAMLQDFLRQLRRELERAGLGYAWPVFVVAQVGTDLHTSAFDEPRARRFSDILRSMGCLLKGHYTDWVNDPQAYPRVGVGGANVGPEFTAAEFEALKDLSNLEQTLCKNGGLRGSRFPEVLEDAVHRSGRWKKWLQPSERQIDFGSLSLERREWLVKTCARYVWTAPEVAKARARLYANLKQIMPDPHAYVVRAIMRSIEKYIEAFRLEDSISVLAGC